MNITNGKATIELPNGILVTYIAWFALREISDYKTYAKLILCKPKK